MDTTKYTNPYNTTKYYLSKEETPSRPRWTPLRRIREILRRKKMPTLEHVNGGKLYHETAHKHGTTDPENQPTSHPPHGFYPVHIPLPFPTPSLM